MDRIPHYNLRSTLYPLDDDFDVQAVYPKKQPQRYWNNVNVEYPIRRYVDTGISSENIGRQWYPAPEVLKEKKTPLEEMKNYFRDYTVTKELNRSQTAKDFGRKAPDTKRFMKHSSCNKNEYVYPPSRRLEDAVPQMTAHGTTEMKDQYPAPSTAPWLVTNKDQHKLLLDPSPPEPSWHKELEPLDTTHEGFEKYLDPYLTTSRLEHRPFTADQMQRPSCNKDIVTYYTFKDITWTRTPKPKTECHLPVPRPKSVYDREKFRQGIREIRAHNKMQCVPGTFRTEARDNYIPPILQPTSQIHNAEEEVKSYFQKRLADLQTNLKEEYNAFKKQYCTENSVVGSGKPICTVFDQYSEKNKRLESKSVLRG